MAKYPLLKIFTDGGSRGNPGKAGVGVHVVDENETTVHDFSYFLGEETNNVAEYNGLLQAISWLKSFLNDHEVARVEFYLDSQLVVEQVKKNWKINQDHLRELAIEVWSKLNQLNIPYSFTHIRREKNKTADMLANQAMDLGQN